MCGETWDLAKYYPFFRDGLTLPEKTGKVYDRRRIACLRRNTAWNAMIWFIRLTWRFSGAS